MGQWGTERLQPKGGLEGDERGKRQTYEFTDFIDGSKTGRELVTINKIVHGRVEFVPFGKMSAKAQFVR
jgi:hypothetical protein